MYRESTCLQTVAGRNKQTRGQAEDDAHVQVGTKRYKITSHNITYKQGLSIQTSPEFDRVF